MKNKLKVFIKHCDYFGINFNFHYKTHEKFHSLTGGIIFLIFLIISTSFVLINLKSLLKRENISIISYKLYKPSTNTINFKNYSLMHAFGIKCSKLDIGKEYEYFKLSVNKVKLTQNDGIVKYDKTPINYSYCTKKHFFNKFNESIDEYGLNQRFCFDDDNITIRGLYTDEIYQYIELTVSMTKINEEDYETYYNLLTTNDCTFQLYHIDYGIDINNFNNPITPYLRQEFLKLTPIDLNKMEIYYLTQKFMTDKNYFFNNYNIEYFVGFSMLTSFSLFKGNDRLEKKPDAYDELAKFFLRADNGINVISRKYMKFTEFLANVSSLISETLLFLYIIVSRINKFYSKGKIMSHAFQIRDLGKKQNNHFLKKLKENLTSIDDSFAQLNNTKNFLTNTMPLTNKKKIEKKMTGNKSSFFKTNKNVLNNNYMNKETITEEMFQNKIKKQRSFDTQSDPNYIRFKFNFFEIIIYFICPCFLGKNFKSKSLLYAQGEKKLFLHTDILSYLKNTQIIEILTYLILDSSQIEIIKFLSKHLLSLDNQDTIKNKVTWNAIKDNKMPDNEIYNFCKGYKKLQNSFQKTMIEKRLLDIVNKEIDNLIGN